MTELIQKYTNKDLSISFEEMLEDFSKVNPTNIPINDICLLRLMGDYSYKMQNKEKWSFCENIGNLFFDVFNAKYPNFHFSLSDFQDIVSQNKDSSPSSIDLKFCDFLDKLYKEKYSLKTTDDMQKYFSFRMSVSQEMQTILSPYKIDWNEVEDKYEKLEEVIGNNFGHLQDDENYASTMDTIEDIKQKANKKIESIIKKYVTDIKEMYLQAIQNKSPVEIILIKTELQTLIYKDFDIDMDKIYEDVVKTYNFNNIINDFMLTLFDVDKSMHRLALNMDLILCQLQELTNPTQTLC
jgi:hypothetical protein